MHIPDGYLSPQTCATAAAVMVPAWWQASRRVQAVVKTRHVPLLALGSAFSFIVMMVNVPVPDGTTAHAVGAGLVAVLLGPWAACVSVSVALLIQALFFGDGGLLTFPANALNMALLMPFAGYGVYRLLSRGSGVTSTRRVLAAAVGSYVGINVAALAAAVEFGLQPALFHRADGSPLYAPFSLSQTIPAMLFAHLTVAGLVEAAVTAGVVSYLRRANPALLRVNAAGTVEDGAAGTVEDGAAGAVEDGAAAPRRPVSPVRAGLVAIAVLAVLTPLGLLAPGGAFGEDAPRDLVGRYGLDAVPTGMQRYADFWGHTLLPGYGNGSRPLYVVSALIGVLVAGAVVWALALLLRRRQLRRRRHAVAAVQAGDGARVGS